MCNSWVYCEACILLAVPGDPNSHQSKVRYSCWVSDTTFFPSLCLAAWFDFFWLTGRPVTPMQKHHSPNLWYGKLKVSSFRSSYYMANRNVFWDLIFLPVWQEDFSMGILAVILCMLNFFTRLELITDFTSGSLCTYTHKIQQVEQRPSNESKYLNVTSIAVWIFPIWKLMILQLSVRQTWF